MRRESVLVYSQEPEVHTVFAEVFRTLGFRVEIREGGPDAVLLELSGWGFVPDFIVLDLSGTADVGQTMADLAARLPDADTEYVVVGENQSIGTYRQLRAMGVLEYFNRPLEAEEINRVLKEAVTVRRDREGSIDPGKLLVVGGACGGAGTSAVAHAVAWGLSEKGKRVMLIDLDFAGGCQYAILGTDESSGFLEIIRSPARLDNLILERTLLQARPNLTVLSEVLGEDQNTGLKDEGLTNLLAAVRTDIDHVVFDLPRSPMIGAGLLGAAHTVVMVSDESLIGLRNMRSIIAGLPTLERRQLTMVINRAGQFTDARVEAPEFENRIGEKAIVLPYDPKGPPKAMFEGQSPMRTRTPWSNAIRTHLVPRLMGQAERKGGILGGLKSLWSR